MGEKRKITLHQTLHGYQEGHRLLATSVELNAAEKTVLSQLSDSSGTGKEPGFVSYLTGYPLPSSRYYAFARTWYADEMPRPGCVWTHTLLIDISMIWMLREPEELLRLFIRPRSLDHLNYNAPLFIEAEEKAPATPHDTELDKFTCLLYASDKKLILLADSAQQFETLILNAWNLQWPRLKRTFKFCTGSLAIRKVGTEIFDLQVVPYSREKSLNRHDRGLVDTVDLALAVCQTDWLQEYARIPPAIMLDFMTQYGADMRPAKTRFAAMVKAFVFAETPHKDAKSGLFNFWDANFDDPEEGRQLKIALFDRCFRNAPKSRYALISGVLSNLSWSAIDWDYQVLIGHAWEAGSLTVDQLRRLLGLLVSHSLPVADLLLKLPAAVWVPELAIYEAILPQLAEKLPISVYNDIWATDEAIQRVWWEQSAAVLKNSPDQLMISMLENESGLFAQEVLSRLGDKTFRILFDWMADTERIPLADWQYLIVLNPAGAFKQLSLHKEFNIQILRLFLDNVSPTNADWRMVSNKNFVKFFGQCEQYPASPLKTAVYTYFLTTCLTGNVDRPDLLVQILFQPLHDSLEADICDRDSWQRFKMELGRDLYILLELDFFSKHFKDRQEVPDWDRCEFLRRSLLSSFLKFQWNIAMLLDVVPNQDTFEKMIEFGVDVKPVKKLFKALRKALEGGPLANSFYFKVLKRNL